MQIEIIIEPDEEVTDPDNRTGLTEEVYERLTDAIASIAGRVVSIGKLT